MRTILAHDSRVIRNVLRGALRSTRYAHAPTIDVQNGGELLRSLNDGSDPETIVLLDWNLPGLDVPTLLGYLDQCGTLDRVSILLCVNPAQVAAAERAVRRGACGFVVRPFTDEALGAKIEEVIPVRSAGEAPSGSAVLRDLVTTIRVQEELPSLLSLPSAIIVQLFEKTTKARYEPGDLILKPGELAESLSFVTLGEVEIEGPDGRQCRGAGECFAERAFVCGEPSKVRVRALTSVDVAAVPKESVVELARRHPALQGFLTAVLTRRIASRGAGAEVELAGTIASLPFPDLLQFLRSTRKTGALVLETGGSQGRIYFERGEVTDARENDESGEAVFHRLADRPDARFEFQAGAASGARTIFQSTMKLLISSFTPPVEVAETESARFEKVG